MGPSGAEQLMAAVSLQAGEWWRCFPLGETSGANFYADGKGWEGYSTKQHGVTDLDSLYEVSGTWPGGQFGVWGAERDAQYQSFC